MEKREPPLLNERAAFDARLQFVYRGVIEKQPGRASATLRTRRGGVSDTGRGRAGYEKSPPRGCHAPEY